MICMICQAGQLDLCDLYDLAHAAGWEPYNLHDILIGHASWVGSALRTYADPAQPLTTAGEELDDRGHDLSDLSDLSEGCNT